MAIYDLTLICGLRKLRSTCLFSQAYEKHVILMAALNKNMEQHIFMEIPRMLSVGHLHIGAIFSIANASITEGKVVAFQRISSCS